MIPQRSTLSLQIGEEEQAVGTRFRLQRKLIEVGINTDPAAFCFFLLSGSHHIYEPVDGGSGSLNRRVENPGDALDRAGAGYHGNIRGTLHGASREDQRGGSGRFPALSQPAQADGRHGREGVGTACQDRDPLLKSGCLCRLRCDLPDHFLRQFYRRKHFREIHSCSLPDLPGPFHAVPVHALGSQSLVQIGDHDSRQPVIDEGARLQIPACFCVQLRLMPLKPEDFPGKKCQRGLSPDDLHKAVITDLFNDLIHLRVRTRILNRQCPAERNTILRHRQHRDRMGTDADSADFIHFLRSQLFSDSFQNHTHMIPPLFRVLLLHSRPGIVMSTRKSSLRAHCSVRAERDCLYICRSHIHSDHICISCFHLSASCSGAAYSA